MVHRNIKKTLYLRHVQVHADDPVHPAGRQQIGNHLGADRFAGLCFEILPRIAVIRHHNRDPLGGCTTEGIDHDQQFHRRFVHWRTGRLHDKNIFATDAFADFDPGLPVRQAIDP